MTLSTLITRTIAGYCNDATPRWGADRLDVTASGVVGGDPTPLRMGKQTAGGLPISAVRCRDVSCGGRLPRAAGLKARRNVTVALRGPCRHDRFQRKDSPKVTDDRAQYSPSND